MVAFQKDLVAIFSVISLSINEERRLSKLRVHKFFFERCEVFSNNVFISCDQIVSWHCQCAVCIFTCGLVGELRCHCSSGKYDSVLLRPSSWLGNLFMHVKFKFWSCSVNLFQKCCWLNWSSKFQSSKMTSPRDHPFDGLKPCWCEYAATGSELFNFVYWFGLFT